MMYSDEETLGLIREALAEYNDGKMDAFVFLVIVSNLVNPHVADESDIKWATDTLKLLRKRGLV